MSTNERPREKRIADELSIPAELVPEQPPVHPESLLNDCEPDAGVEELPQTRLLLEGVDPDGITVEFLVRVHDTAADLGLSLDGISVSSG